MTDLELAEICQQSHVSVMGCNRCEGSKQDSVYMNGSTGLQPFALCKVHINFDSEINPLLMNMISHLFLDGIG